MKKLTFILLLIIVSCSCTGLKPKGNEIERLKAENDNLKLSLKERQSPPKTQISTFLTFQENNAEEAMNFYVSLFDNSEIIEIQRHGEDGPAKEGSIMVASFVLNGKQFMCSDSYIKHEWNFTPGVSNFVECKTMNELETLFKKLSHKGKALMRLDNYGFSQKFGFVEDQFGVSWQLNFQ